MHYVFPTVVVISTFAIICACKNDAPPRVKEVTAAKPQTGFSLQTDPPGATVYLNDFLMDKKTPLTLTDLQPGTHSIRIVKEGYLAKTIEIDIVAGVMANLPTKRLEFKGVKIKFPGGNTPGDLVVLICDGQRIEVGYTPVEYMLDNNKLEQCDVEYLRSGSVIFRKKLFDPKDYDEPRV